MSRTQEMNLVRNEHIECEMIGSEYVLLHMESHQVTKLNEIGGRIWSLIPECSHAEAIATRIAAEYGADEDRVREDVNRFIGELLQNRLLDYA